MNSPGRVRSAGEVREFFKERLNHALLYPGMYGGELTLQLLLMDLAWMDGRDSQLRPVVEMLGAFGAWSEIGVCGAFMRMFGGSQADHHRAAALVYADIAAAWGYLAPDRTLSSAEYGRLRRDEAWTQQGDRGVADLVAEFGLPSLWRPKYNPSFPTSIGYVSENHSDPLVAFDFWQEAPLGDEGTDSRFGPEPVLRNVRWRTDHFASGFIFSPIGSTLIACENGGDQHGGDQH